MPVAAGATDGAVVLVAAVAATPKLKPPDDAGAGAVVLADVPKLKPVVLVGALLPKLKPVLPVVVVEVVLLLPNPNTGAADDAVLPKLKPLDEIPPALPLAGDALVAALAGAFGFGVSHARHLLALFGLEARHVPHFHLSALDNILLDQD